MKFQQGTRSWGEALRVYSRPEVVRMLFLGFSAGLPLLLVFSTQRLPCQISQYAQ
ncbi:MAG: hypothetical protein ACKVHB_01480 [Pseudomonadales bacterium]